MMPIEQSHEKRPKVALLTDTFVVGGGLQHITQIARSMSEIVVGIFANGGSEFGKLVALPNVQIFPDGYHLENLRRFQPDLVHVHHLKPLLAVLNNPFREIPFPVVFTVHGLHIHKYEFLKGFSSETKYQLRFQLEKYLLKKVKKVITVSEEDAEFVRQNYGITHPVCIPNGIDYSEIRTADYSKTELRQSLNLPENARIFLTVARFPFQKAHDILLAAIAKSQAKLRQSGAKFVLIGDGEFFSEMQQLATSTGISDLLMFLGRRHNVPDFMHASDYFLLPSRWEGFPITLLEAAGCNLPIVASDTFGNREIVFHRRSGLLFENENSDELSKILCDVLAGKYDMQAFADAAYQYVNANFTAEIMVDKIRDVYESVLQPEVVFSEMV